MKRLVYAFDSAAAAKTALASLALIGVEKKNLSLAARPDVQLEQIPDTAIDPSMDFAPSIARGVALGWRYHRWESRSAARACSAFSREAR